MNLFSVRIITEDVKRLADFYNQVTGLPVIQYTEDFAELRTSQANLAIGSTRTLAMFGGPTVAAPASNYSAIIEFRVEDVDARYREIAELIANAVVDGPATKPWGNRSLLFRDPDGNLVNFFTPVTEEAKSRFA